MSLNASADPFFKTSTMLPCGYNKEVRQKTLETEEKEGICMTSEEYYYFGQEWEYAPPKSYDIRNYENTVVSSVVQTPKIQQPQSDFHSDDSECEGQIMGLSRRDEEEVRISALVY